MSKLQSRLARIEGQLHGQGRQQGLWDLSLLSNEALEKLAGFMDHSPTREELEELVATLPDELLQKIERVYGGMDEQA